MPRLLAYQDLASLVRGNPDCRFSTICLATGSTPIAASWMV